MNCRELEQQLDGWLDGELAPDRSDAVDRHLAECGTCALRAREARALQSMLKSQPVPPPTPGFFARALRQARVRGGQRNGFAAGFATAAVLALAVGIGVFGWRPADESAPLQQVALTVGQPQQVSLVFDVPRELQQAVVAMELPSSVQLAGYEGQRTLEWQTGLAAGRNVLTLPLVASGPVEGVLTARIRHGETEKQFSIRLVAGSPAAANAAAARQV